MKIDKVNNSFNTYKIELSYSEMMAAFKALAQSHADPVADEMFRGLQYYIERLPGPGEDKEKESDKDQDIEIDIDKGDVDLDNLLPEPEGEEISLEPGQPGDEPEGDEPEGDELPGESPDEER